MSINVHVWYYNSRTKSILYQHDTGRMFHEKRKMSLEYTYFNYDKHVL